MTQEKSIHSPQSAPKPHDYDSLQNDHRLLEGAYALANTNIKQLREDLYVARRERAEARDLLNKWQDMHRNSRLTAEAQVSALSESSPKSGSVPAVAGGGEDGARLDWLEKQKADLFEVHGRWYVYDAMSSDTARPTAREAIDAAIAATKAPAQGKRGPR